MTTREEKETRIHKHRRTKTQPTLKNHAPAARCNQDQDARSAAARRHTPRPPRRAQHSNAHSDRKATRTDRRVRSHSRMKRKEGRHHDATGRERNSHPQAKIDRNATNTYKPRTSCTMQPITKTKTPAVPPPAATHHARRATPCPTPHSHKATGKHPERIAV